MADGLVSERGAQALLDLLLERGYFHDGVDPAKSNVHRASEENLRQFPRDTAILLSTSSNGFYATVDHLRQQFCVRLQEVGRWSLADATAFLGVTKEQLESRILVPVLEQQGSTLLRVDEEILTSECLDELGAKAVLFLEDLNGRVSLADLAQYVYKFASLETTLQALQGRLPENVQIRTLSNGSKVLVSQAYLDEYRSNVVKAFAALTEEPVHVSAVANEQSWEPSWVLEFLKDSVDYLPGKLSGDTYTPDVYTEGNRKALHGFYAANGFVTREECPTFGITLSQMKDYVQEEFESSALVLKDSVVHPDLIVAPFVAAVQETIAGETWLDLSLHLPGQLLSLEEDAKIIVNDHVLSQVDDESPGVALFSACGAVFFSHGFIQSVRETLLPPLLKDFAKARAEELFAGDSVPPPSPPPPVSGKEKRKKKRSSGKASKSSSVDESSDCGVVPVQVIVGATVGAFPDLEEFARTHNDDTSPLHGLVVQEFHDSSDFRAECQRMVQAELRQLQSEQASKASHKSKATASEIQSVEGAFEDPACFATACYVVQAQVKFLQYATTSFELEDAVVEALKVDFLQSCCADFTRRITQFCLFHNEVDDGVFTFEKADAVSADPGALPYYCSPVDPAVRSYPPTFLSCTPDDKLKARDPLPALREVLPGSVGVSLARQWVLCGGDCYQGGVKKKDDGGGVFVRPGDVDGFLAHVEENCLTLCGLPFKKIDKKAEKQLLFARRQRLVQLLDAATEPAEVLDLTVMLLYQLVKNLVVSGPLLRGPVLKQLLAKERKISEDVASTLCELADCLERGDTVDASLVERVKACGLHKDKR